MSTSVPLGTRRPLGGGQRPPESLARTPAPPAAGGESVVPSLAVVRSESIAAATVRRLPVIRTLSEILANPEALQPPEPIIPGLAYRGRVTLLAAREKAGKSTLMGTAAAALSAGASFAGQPLRRGRVLWIGLEEHEGDIARRFVEAGADPDRVFVIGSLLGDKLEEIAAAAEQVRPDLLVLDTLPALAEGLVTDSGSSAQWTRVMSALTGIARDSSAASVLLHHARRSDGSYRDSSAIGAGVDAIIEMSEVSSDPALRRFQPKARWKAEEFSLRLVGTRYERASGQLSLETRVLFFVQENPGSSKNAVRKGVGGKHSEIDACLERLCQQGAIEDRGGETGHSYYPRTAGEGSLLSESGGKAMGNPLAPTQLVEGQGLGAVGGNPLPQIANPIGATWATPQIEHQGTDDSQPPLGGEGRAV